VLFISASVGGIPVYTGVRVIYADEESFTVMTPEGHPESGWNTFSAYRDEDGITVAQIQSLARANDPIYELGLRIVGSTEQERIWTHVLKSLAAHFGVNEPVTLEKVCVDPTLQWSQVKNVWQNAGVRSMLYTMEDLGRRRMGNLLRRLSSRRPAEDLPDGTRSQNGLYAHRGQDSRTSGNRPPPHERLIPSPSRPRRP